MAILLLRARLRQQNLAHIRLEAGAGFFTVGNVL